jgi:hypothetical protein
MDNIVNFLDLVFNFVILMGIEVVHRGIRKRINMNKVDRILDRELRCNAFWREKDIIKFRENKTYQMKLTQMSYMA